MAETNRNRAPLPRNTLVMVHYTVYIYAVYILFIEPVIGGRRGLEGPQGSQVHGGGHESEGALGATVFICTVHISMKPEIC